MGDALGSEVSLIYSTEHIARRLELESIYVNLCQTATGGYTDGRPAGNLAIRMACDVCELNFYDTPHWSLILVPTNPSSKLEDYKLDENIHSVPL